MAKRYTAIWLPHLMVDSLQLRKKELQGEAVVLIATEKGRTIIKDLSVAASRVGLQKGMVLADARALVPNLHVFTYDAQKANSLLLAIAKRCFRFSPTVALNNPNGIILDSSGCTHLWGGEAAYIATIQHLFEKGGYHIRLAIADTIGAAWALSRYAAATSTLVPQGKQKEFIQNLPPAALRLELSILQRMHHLGFKYIGQFIDMPSRMLERRFGKPLLQRLQQALVDGKEPLEAIVIPQPYCVQLPALEPIRTAKGIEIALTQLLEQLCERLIKEGKGLRLLHFKGKRLDGKWEEIQIGTTEASRDKLHLHKLFIPKLSSIRPGMGIELFELEASLIAPVAQVQDTLWDVQQQQQQLALAQLLDTIANKMGKHKLKRFMPEESYWPENAVSQHEPLASIKMPTKWPTRLIRPIHLLPKPEPITVMVPLPDYPPLHFTYKQRIHKVMKADGPERIAQEWWRASSPPRDYYSVEDQYGARFWIFRLGLYGESEPQWFMHGFFA